MQMFCGGEIEQEELTSILGEKNTPLARKDKGMTVILMAGLQGRTQSRTLSPTS